MDITWIAAVPSELRDFLVTRNVIEQISDGDYVGRLPGVEITWNSVPNPLDRRDENGDPLDTVVPTIVRNAKVYLMRLSHEADADDTNGDVPDENDENPRFTRSKLAKWVRDNSTKLTINYDGGSFDFFRVTASWGIVHPKDAAMFGEWQ